MDSCIVSNYVYDKRHVTSLICHAYQLASPAIVRPCQWMEIPSETDGQSAGILLMTFTMSLDPDSTSMAGLDRPLIRITGLWKQSGAACKVVQ